MGGQNEAKNRVFSFKKLRLDIFQKKLTDNVEAKIYHELYHGSTDRNKALLNTLYNNKCHGYLHVVPNNYYGVKFSNIEFNLLLKINIGDSDFSL